MHTVKRIKMHVIELFVRESEVRESEHIFYVHVPPVWFHISDDTLLNIKTAETCENQISKKTNAKVKTKYCMNYPTNSYKRSKVNVCKDQELKKSEPESSPQNQNGK